MDRLPGTKSKPILAPHHVYLRFPYDGPEHTPSSRSVLKGMPVIRTTDEEREVWMCALGTKTALHRSLPDAYPAHCRLQRD
ncbi:hypothetical protein ACVWZZ_004824 [Bradyrhizobium sp. LM6.10]